jgi:hypothetical protein
MEFESSHCQKISVVQWIRISAKVRFKQNTMTQKEFNEKYRDYLDVEGQAGLQFDNKEVIDHLDEIFSDLIKIPNFKYSTIKMKFGTARVYTAGISKSIELAIESLIDTLLFNEHLKKKEHPNQNY